VETAGACMPLMPLATFRLQSLGYPR
jgi:hypothetical protein